MTVTLSLTREELRVLNVWGCNTVAGGHWGDGDVMLGEESELIRKIQGNDTGVLELNPVELRVLLYWMEENHQQSGKITGSPAAASLAEKITRARESSISGGN